MSDHKPKVFNVNNQQTLADIRKAAEQAAAALAGVKASAGTHGGFGIYVSGERAQAEARAREMLEQEAAQRVLMQILSWCVVRLGGEVKIPRAVLEGVTYFIEQETDPVGYVIVRASENRSAEVTNDDEQDEADPWS